MKRQTNPQRLAQRWQRYEEGPRRSRGKSGNEALGESLNALAANAGARLDLHPVFSKRGNRGGQVVIVKGIPEPVQ